MNCKTNIRLIYSHAKRMGADQNGNLIILEIPLNLALDLVPF